MAPNPETVIQSIRESFVGAVTVFSSGSCYQLFKVLKTIYPSAEAWQTIDGHIVTFIPEFQECFDINGIVNRGNLRQVDAEEAKRLSWHKYVMGRECKCPEKIEE